MRYLPLNLRLAAIARLVAPAAVVALLVAAVWLRVDDLDHLPGLNGDEAWYGVKAIEILRSEPTAWRTPTDNPLNPLFFGPMIAVHAAAGPSIGALRAVALASGLAALGVNGLLCRRVFGRRMAWLTTLVLAALPVNIAYSRFAWDTSQTLLVTLPIWYASLAAVGPTRRPWRWLLVASAAQCLAVLVHPTNVFAAVAIFGAALLRMPRRLGRFRRRAIVATAAVAAVVLAALAVVATSWLTAGGLALLAQRARGIEQLATPGGLADLVVLYPRLFAGQSIYEFLSGADSWWIWPALGPRRWGLDVAIFWLVLGAAGWRVYCSWRDERSVADRLLLAATALTLLAWLLVAGPLGLRPGMERYALVLIAPTILVLARGGLLWFERLGLAPRRALMAAAGLAACLVMADFHAQYFVAIRRTGGLAHPTFRTGPIEPKWAAWRMIRQDAARAIEPEAATTSAARTSTWVIASSWWNYWPMRYFAAETPGVRVVRPDELFGAMPPPHSPGPSGQNGAPSADGGLPVGRFWWVEFAGSAEEAEARRRLCGRDVAETSLPDYAGRPVLRLLSWEVPPYPKPPRPHIGPPTGEAGPRNVPSPTGFGGSNGVHPSDPTMIDDALQWLESGRDLTMDRMSDVLGEVIEGRVDAERTGRLLVALHRKGETTAEVAGAAAALRRKMTPIRTSRPDVLDVVGTGGDGSGTFNISTAAAIVTAAAGAPVAKHGNRRFTSRSGSADVLAALGVNVEADVACVESCLEQLGLCFCFAPLLHQAMRHVAAVRRELPHPTIFNLLGPLANPAGAPFQLIGVGRPALRPLLAEAVALLGTRRSVVVHGADGLDEVTLGGETLATEVGPTGAREHRWSPRDFELEPVGRDALMVAGPEESAAVIRSILSGRRGAARDVVVANAAAALWTAGRAATLSQGAAQAAEAIDSGAAGDLLARLVERTCAG